MMPRYLILILAPLIAAACSSNAPEIVLPTATDALPMATPSPITTPAAFVALDPTATHTAQPSPSATRAPQPTSTLTASRVPSSTATPHPTQPAATPTPLVPTAPTAQTGNCDPAYPDVCISPSPPDLDCPDIPFRRFAVLQPDPHRFDRDKNGIGCERD